MKSFKQTLEIYNSIFTKQKFPIEYYCRSQFFFLDLLGERSIIDKNKINLKSIIYFLFCLIVTIRSLITLLKIFYNKKIYVAHFQIGVKNSSNLFYDNRSHYIIKKIPLEKTINFIYSKNSKFIILNFFRYPNPIFIKEIYYLITFFNNFKNINKKDEINSFFKKKYNKKKKLIKRYSYLVANSYQIINFLNKFLSILKIKKFIFINDSRYINELILACKNNKIRTIGYMHGHLNKYHIGLRHIKFDNYLCWSSYFKKKILLLNTQYKSKEIKIIGHPYWNKFNFLKKEKNDKINILIIGENSINYKYVAKYILEILKNDTYKVFFRDKPGFNVLDSFLKNIKSNKIIIDEQKNIYESLKNNEIHLVVGTLSTVLLESWIFGIPSLIIKNPYDYASYIYKDGLSQLVNNPRNIENIIKKNILFKKNFLKKRCNKIWSSNSYIKNNQNFNKIVKTII
jgi:hypothetical protein